jgi:cytidine deaminase
MHAEVVALGSLVAGGGDRPVALLIAAHRDKFTPCGACLDWIFELGGSECVIFVQTDPGATATRFLAGELMPHYPT